MNNRLVSVVLPVYDEEDNVQTIVEQIESLFGSLPYRLEIVLVDDGSAAPTAERIDLLASRRTAVGAIHLSRNFGHQAALTAGIEAARGDAVISLDADLQHPVATIPALLEQWERGSEVVHTIREDDGSSAGAFKRLTSAAFYRMLNALSEVTVVPNTADFRLLDRAAVDALLALPERARFLRGLTVWVGFRQSYVRYTSAPRRSGRSKYDLRKMLNLALSGVVSMSTAPLRFALVLGSSLSVLAFGYLLWVLVAYFFTDRAIHGWSSLIVALLFLGGLQINLIGVLGIYVGKIYEEVKGRPAYIVSRTSGFLAEQSRREAATEQRAVRLAHRR